MDHLLSSKKVLNRSRGEMEASPRGDYRDENESRSRGLMRD